MAILGLVIMGLTSGLNALAIQKLKPVFDELFKLLAQADEATKQVQMQRLLKVCLVLFGVFTAAAIGTGISSYLAAWSGQHLLRDLRRALFTRIERMPMAFFERQPAGVLISRISNDVQMLEATFSGDLANLVIGPLSGLGFLGLMAYSSWRLTLMMLIAVPTILGITKLLGTGVRRHAERAQEKIARLSGRIHEAVAGIRIVRVFGLEKAMEERFCAENEGALRERMRVFRLRAANRPATGLLSAGAVVATLILGGEEILAGRLDPSGLMTFLFLGVQAGNYLGKFSQQLLALQQSEGSAQRVLQLLESPVEPPDPPDALELPHIQGRLEFRDVCFAYEPDRPVLEDFNLTLEVGEHVALVGPSGSGKTTIANLAARLYDPDQGAVLVDGVDLRQVKRESYRAQVALVPQDTVLFGGTVRENIGFGRPDATEEEIIEAARAARAHDFIMSLPEGYDTELTDLGQNLSGGQRQRIAIARAFVRRPRILILDEATAQLDRENEAAIQESLSRLMVGCTTLIVAHRLSTIRNADRIIVLLEGRVVEEGTHDELLAAGGVYHRLYHAQAAEEATRTSEDRTAGNDDA
ncbi:MAG: ABC transporter ATP-binding protein [Armatimonadetes bacterium]|nr:ABC transporter ATP-binding protein [Armatimonadota bacterium]